VGAVVGSHPKSSIKPIEEYWAVIIL
jgi:hypothetical protein